MLIRNPATHDSQTPNVELRHLTSVGRVGTEIGRLYPWLARRKEIDTLEAFRLTQVLLGLKACLRDSEFERRVAKLEAQLTEGTVEHFRPKVVA